MIKIFLFVIAFFISFSFSAVAQFEGELQKIKGPQGGKVTSVACKGDTIYAGIADEQVSGSIQTGLYRSTDYGKNWKLLYDSDVNAIALINDNVIIAVYDYGIAARTNGGESWITSTSFDKNITCLIVKDSIVFAGSERGGIYKSTDYGLNWIETDFTSDVNTLAVSDSTIYAGTYGGVYKSTNNGESWELSEIGEFGEWVLSLVAKNNLIFAGTYYGLYKSTDNGGTWTLADFEYKNISMLATDGINFYAGVEDDLYISKNNGNSWTKTELNDKVISSCFYKDNIIVGTSENGIYTSNNECSSWEQIGISISFIYVIKKNGNNLYAGTGGNGVHLSTDEGKSWKNIGLSNLSIRPVEVVEDNIFAGTYGFNGVFFSTNNGLDWSNIGLSDYDIISIFSIYNKLYVSAHNEENEYKCFFSTDLGENWTDISEQFNSGAVFKDFVIYENNGILATSSGIFLSSDKGDNWQRVASEYVYCNKIVVLDNCMLAATDYGLFISTNGGSLWYEFNSNLEHSNFFSMIQYEEYLVALCNADKIFISTDNGYNWTQIVDVGNFTENMVLLNNTLFLATYDGIFKLELESSSVLTPEPLQENSFSIFPNPVDNIANLKCELNNTSNIKVTLTNSYGLQVKEMFFENIENEINFDISDLPIGLYVVTFTSKDFSASQKMVIMR